MDISFHCDENKNFHFPEQMLRAFSYREYAIRAHDHDFYELNIVLGGSGVHQIENASLLVRRGDVFMIPPHTVHAYTDTTHLEVYHVLFRREFIDQNRPEAEGVRGFIELTEIEPLLRRHTATALLRLTPRELSGVYAELSLLDEETGENEVGDEPLRRHAAWKLLYTLSRLLHERIKGGFSVQSVQDRHANAITALLTYIHAHLSEDLSLGHLCRLSYLSRSTLLRAFSAICGATPSEYVTECRLRQAEYLLRDGKHSKTEIAHLVGFYDLSHMERARGKQNRKKT